MTPEQILETLQEDNLEDEEFIMCEHCDGHPACEDFGCAIALGLGRLVNKEPGTDDWG